MKNLITLVKKLFKPVAMVKYLFFPFMMAQSQGAVDFTSITHGETIVAQAESAETVWLGTNNGIYAVNKANGKFIHLTTANSVLPSNHVAGVCVCPDGNFYAATDRGIFRFDGSAYLTITTENAKLPTNEFTSIACDEKGRIFAGTQNSGLVMIKNYRCQIFNRYNSDLTTNTVTNVYLDENGLIIAKLGNGNYAAMGNSTLVLINAAKPDMDATAKGN